MGKKETPYRYVDTHAGAGDFILTEGYAAEHEEWRSGIERLRSFAAAPNNVPPLAIRNYMDLVDTFGKLEGTAAAYPGSPAIAATIMRRDDRAILFELHPADHSTLASRFRADGRFQVRKAEGLHGLRSVLPPPSRRALVLVDPSYEVKDEYDTVVAAIADALRRFATGVYLIWYPLLEREDALSLPQRLLELHGGTRCRAELRVKRAREDGRGMSGSGVVILNPPWTLRAALEESLPYLARALGEEDAAGKLLWEEESATRTGSAVSKK
jgi:23S rRNA (adenine2030-N6)-methyltransferase